MQELIFTEEGERRMALKLQALDDTAGGDLDWLTVVVVDVNKGLNRP